MTRVVGGFIGWMPLLILAVLSGCGGGGASVGGSGGSISVSTSSLSFSATEADSTPLQKTFSVSANSGTVFVDVATTGPFSATLQLNGGATGTITVSAASGATMGAGTHTGTVVITAYKDLFGKLPAGSPKTVKVTYKVTSGFTASPNYINFEAIKDAALPAAMSVTVADTQAGSYAWNATIEYLSGSGWLHINGHNSASGGALPANLSVSVTTPAALNVYYANIHVKGGGREVIIPVALNYRVAATDLSTSGLSFASTVAATTVPAVQQLGITGENIGWTLTASEPWVQLSATAGTGPGAIDVSVVPGGLSGGLHYATLTLSDSVGGATNAAVVLAMQPRRLQVSRVGVALSSTATVAHLSDILQVSENAGVPVGWTATSDQSWLTVTASGNTGDSLIVTADPTGLAVEQIHYANVTVASNDATISNAETVRVGFYVTALTPQSSLSVVATGANVQADPIRPYVYVTSQRACSGFHSAHPDIDVYNVYSGALVGTIHGPAGAALSEMTVNTDGSMLYVLDTYDGAIFNIDIDNWTVGDRWEVLGASEMTGCADLSYVRANGRGLLLTSRQHIVDTASGWSLGKFTGPSELSTKHMMLAPSGDGAHLFTAVASSGYDGIDHYAINFDRAYGSVEVRHTAGMSTPLNLIYLDVAADQKGGHLYVADFDSPGIYEFDGSAFGPALVPGAGFISSIEVGPNGKLYAGTGTTASRADLWVYDAVGTSIGSYDMPLEAFQRQVAVSGDGMRLIQMGFSLGIVGTTP